MLLLLWIVVSDFVFDFHIIRRTKKKVEKPKTDRSRGEKKKIDQT